MHVKAQLLSYLHVITSKNRLPLCIFFLGKLANVLLRNLLQRTGSIFDALIQRTDGCLDVPWLLVQPHHSIHCSYKLYINRNLSQHMIFQYQDEDSGEPVQMYRLARAFSA